MKNTTKKMAKEIDDDSYEHPTHTANRLSKSAYRKKTKEAHIAAVKAHKTAYKHHGSLEVQSYRTYYWQKYHMNNVNKHKAIIDVL